MAAKVKAAKRKRRERSPAEADASEGARPLLRLAVVVLGLGWACFQLIVCVRTALALLDARDEGDE